MLKRTTAALLCVIPIAACLPFSAAAETGEFNTSSVSLSNYQSAAVTSDGSLYIWGNNSFGQLVTELPSTVIHRKK